LPTVAAVRALSPSTRHSARLSCRYASAAALSSCMPASPPAAFSARARPAAAALAAGQRALQPLARLAEVAAQHPEAVERAGQGQASVQVAAVQRPVKNGPKIVVLTFEQVERIAHAPSNRRGIGLLGDGQAMQRVPLTRLGQLAVLGQASSA